ncbi:hypothetical protein RJ639_031338 [Escallonia herrerae]|uniref:Myb-like domain-containing protein n=1 Tax=Escallonia herrerae TaxID=1293975 RepID=A0AA88XCP9_9ASTE|nr:hypothetical protein RJ639_031338 [Escallonia herrerae]
MLKTNMGLKRPFDEEFPTLSFKHPKQLDCGDKLTLHAADNSLYESLQRADFPNLAGKEFQTREPGSLVNSSSSSFEEDTGSRAVFSSSLFPEYFEFTLPRRSLVHFEDIYSALMNCSPRKEVPLGPNHQVDIPVWDAEMNDKFFLRPTCIVDDDNVETPMGACVTPMPSLDFSVYTKAGDGKMDCSCLDGGSVRCVRQHVKEAREKLRESLGHEKFVDLGFHDMGEEIASTWTEEEEHAFHEVVYSNPVSLGKKFWEHLQRTFPSRTRKEFVSYYFNVFMLRKRASQNRSNFLEIDSDDDEWQGGGPLEVREEDDDSAVESLSNQDIRVDHGADSPNEYDDDDEDDDDSDNDDGDDDVQVSGADATRNDYRSGQMSKAPTENPLADRQVDLTVRHVDEIPGSIKGDSDTQEDSCTSFEGEPCMTVFHGSVGEGTVLRENRAKGDHGKFLHGNSEYVLEPCDAKLWDCDAKLWDPTYSIGLIKGVDLLPTRNMIEEIFGPCTLNSKSSNDESIS